MIISESFFKDTNGKWAIIQFPNPLLMTWLLLMVLSVALTNPILSSSINQLKDALLLAWGYMELTTGISSFRKVFGGLIMILIIIGYFL